MRKLFSFAALWLIVGAPLHAQDPEPPKDSTIDLGSILYDRERGGLKISSAKTYNRVEGLPVYIGPTYTGPIGRADVSIAALGIIRSSNKFHWDLAESRASSHRRRAGERRGIRSVHRPSMKSRR